MSPVFPAIRPRWTFRGFCLQTLAAGGLLLGGLPVILAFGFLLFLAIAFLNVGP